MENRPCVCPHTSVCVFGELGTRGRNVSIWVSEPNNGPYLGRLGSGWTWGRAKTSVERTSGGLALWAEYSDGSVTEWGETGEGWWHAPGPKSGEGRLEIGVVKVYDRGLFCIWQSSVCVLSGWGMLLSWVTGGHYVGLMSLLGVLKLHTELVRQTAHYQHAWWSHQKISASWAGILLRRPSLDSSADSKLRKVSIELSLL